MLVENRIGAGNICLLRAPTESAVSGVRIITSAKCTCNLTSITCRTWGIVINWVKRSCAALGQYSSLLLTNNIHAYSLNSNKLWYISMMWTARRFHSFDVSLKIHRNLKKYLTTYNSFFHYSNRSSVLTRRTTNSTVSTPARSPYKVNYGTYFWM